MRFWRKLIIGIVGLILLIASVGAWVCLSLQSKIKQRLEKGWVVPPIELYSQGFAVSEGRQFPLAEIEEEMRRLNWTPERDYVLGDRDVCDAKVPATLKLSELSRHCLLIKNPRQIITWDDNLWTQEIWIGDPPEKRKNVALFPRLITQFFDETPVLQKTAPLAEFPLACLQAATAIEDRDFLEHGGISPTGMMRALWRDLKMRRFAEGGSTITQQLVKNFFLNSKKTLRRKVEEQILAILLESQLSKDQILEMYLNVIYMGQSGPYQVRGFGSAADYYFEKGLAELSLPECALLAALINNPGRYSPFAHPDAAAGRRALVLRKMHEFNMIDEGEADQATTAPLPTPPDTEHRAYAPYFAMSAFKEFSALGLDVEEGARIYSTLDPEVQALAESAVQTTLPAVEARIKKPSPEPLQVATLTVDVASGQALALIGGRNFGHSQFNRASDSRRQIGSTVKPFVYLPALSKGQTPVSLIHDEPMVWKTGRQVWRPRNFEPKSFGEIPYFFALAHSLNLSAAHVGQDVGLDQVSRALHAAGIEASFPLLPSLTLGAIELPPWDVAQGYLTLARLGSPIKLHALLRVEDLNGRQLYTAEPSTSTPTIAAGQGGAGAGAAVDPGAGGGVGAGAGSARGAGGAAGLAKGEVSGSLLADSGLGFDPIPSSVLVGMLKQTIALGTAKAASHVPELQKVYAGKTGTTSDTKDAWFAGFNPHLLHVVWVGYDDNTEMGLTGAGAALPVWIQIAKSTNALFPDDDFHWPEGVELRTLSRDSLIDKFSGLKENGGEMPAEVILVFAKGSE